MEGRERMDELIYYIHNCLLNRNIIILKQLMYVL